MNSQPEDETPTQKTNKHTRIQAACRELELALNAFEDDTEAKEHARREAEKLQALKEKLIELRQQLDTLST